MRQMRGSVGLLGLVFLASVPMEAQEPSGSWASAFHTARVRGCCETAGPPVLQAEAVADEEIRIDGRATEGPWLGAPVATGFVQFEPGEGDPATERTEAKVLYGQDALYVAVRAFDSKPGEIVGQLTRRDQPSYSDQVGVVIDSYFDRRTAFHFAVNPVGVKYDVYRFDDTEEDAGWDAVWEVATSRDDEGWTAEFRIPYSQLRFRDQTEQTWGINFLRRIARNEETDVWAPTSRRESAIVSRFGELRGLRGLEAPRRMEVMPYTMARLERAPGDPQDPFYRRTATAGAVGADLKYGVTSDLTLDVTLNPDFGQVEADPAQVNLTAFETFLPEQRPFFLEGASIFNFGIALGDGEGANESLFYSRRIGRAPQGRADPQGGYSESDDQTTILGAWKLSGKTASGWSIGALHGVTAEEKARVAPAAGPEFDDPVEPKTHYGVLRVQKDFRAGRSAVGVIGTLVDRNRETADALELRRAAYAGGVDFRHRFGGDRYQVQGYVLGSRIVGSEEAIARAQRSPARYYQRPDAEHIQYDPTRTSLSGASAFLAVAKIGGEHWRFSTGLHTRTPGFEVNDIGYQRDADSFINWFWVGYQQNTPQGPFRRWNLNTNGWTAWNYDGDRAGLGANVNGSVQLRSFWRIHAGVNRDGTGYSGRTLRGGPLFRSEPVTSFWAGVGGDSRKAVQLNLGVNGTVREDSDSWSLAVSPNIRFRPSGRATFTLGSFLRRNLDDYQWIGSFEGEDMDYVFGRIDQTTVGLTTRVDFAFTPTLSLQLYAQPFVSAGQFSEFKRVADPLAERYADRFQSLPSSRQDGGVTLDVDGDGISETLDEPDFNFKQFRSNVVVRWEYSPGSTVFLVWSQGRAQTLPHGSFDLEGDLDDLFRVAPENVFMVKVSYWLNP